MSTLFPDTRPEAEVVLIRLLREAPPWRKLEMVGQMNEAIKTIRVIEVFEKLNIPYLIGGSLASALYGTATSTLDADLVADLQPEQVTPLVEMLSHDFYIDH